MSGFNGMAPVNGYTKAQVDGLIAKEKAVVTAGQGITLQPNFQVVKSGNVVVINDTVGIGSTALAGYDDVLFTLPEGFRPAEYVHILCFATYVGNNGFFTFRVNPNGTVTTATGSGTFNANSYVSFISAVYMLG